MSQCSSNYEDDFEDAGEENALLKYTASLSRSLPPASCSPTSSAKSDQVKNSEDAHNSTSLSPSTDATDQNQVCKPQSRILAANSSLSHQIKTSLNPVFLHVSNVTAVVRLDPEPPNRYCRADQPDSVADEDDHTKTLHSTCSVADQCSLKYRKDTLSGRTFSKSTLSSSRRDSLSSSSSSSSLPSSSSHSNISPSGVSPIDTMLSQCEMASPDMQGKTIGPVMHENNQAQRLNEENISPLKVMYSEPTPVNDDARREPGSKHSLTDENISPLKVMYSEPTPVNGDARREPGSIHSWTEENISPLKVMYSEPTPVNDDARREPGSKHSLTEENISPLKVMYSEPTPVNGNARRRVPGSKHSLTEENISPLKVMYSEPTPVNDDARREPGSKHSLTDENISPLKVMYSEPTPVNGNARRRVPGSKYFLTEENISPLKVMYSEPTPVNGNARRRVPGSKHSLTEENISPLKVMYSEPTPVNDDARREPGSKHSLTEDNISPLKVMYSEPTPVNGDARREPGSKHSLTEENISPLKVMYSEPTPVNGDARRVPGSKHSLTEENISPLKVMYSEPTPVNGDARRVPGSKHSITTLAESSPTHKKHENNLDGSVPEFSTVERKTRLSLTPCNISFGDKNKVQNGLPVLSRLQSPMSVTSSKCNAVGTQKCPSNIDTSASILYVSSNLCTPQVWKKRTIMRNVSCHSSPRSSTPETKRSQSGGISPRPQKIRKSSRNIAIGTDDVEKVQASDSASKFTAPHPNKHSNVYTSLKGKKRSKCTPQSGFPFSHANANERRRSTTQRPRSISPTHIEMPNSVVSSPRAELLHQIKELKHKLSVVRKDKVRAMSAKRGSEHDRNWDNEPDNAPSSEGRWRIRRLVERLRRENRYLQNLVKIRQGRELNISLIMCMITEDMKHAQEELREVKKRKRELISEDRRAAMAHRITAKSEVTQREIRAKQHRDGDYSRAALQSKVNEMREKIEGLKTSTPHLMERIEALSADVQRRGLSNIKPAEYENLKAIVVKNEKVIERLRNSIAIHTSNECLGPIGGVNYGDEYLSQVPFPAKAELTKMFRKLTQQVERKEEELRNCRLSIGIKPDRDVDLCGNLRTDRYKLLNGPAPIRALAGNTSGTPANQSNSCVPSYTPPARPVGALQPSGGDILAKDAALALRTKKDDEKLPQIDYQRPTQSQSQPQQQQQMLAQLPDVRGSSDDKPMGIVRLMSKKSSQKYLIPSSSPEPLPAKGSSTNSPCNSVLGSLRRRVAEVNVEYVEQVDDLLEKYREEVKIVEDKSKPQQPRDVSTQNNLSLSPSLLAMKRSDSLNEMEEEVSESGHSCGNAPNWLQA